jgi:hypothetical protein
MDSRLTPAIPTSRLSILLWYLGAFALFSVYFFYLSFCSVRHPDSRRYYNKLADAFLHGQIALLEKPDIALDQAENPYIGGNLIHAEELPDCSYYKKRGAAHGNYYIYWGPVPVILLFYPWKLFFGQDLSEELAQYLIILANIVVFGMIVRRLTDWFDQVNPPYQIAVWFVMSIGNLQPFLATESDVYRISLCSASVGISLGYLLLCWALPNREGAVIKLVPLSLGCGFLALAHLGRAVHCLDVLAVACLILYLFKQQKITYPLIERQLGAIFLPLCLIGLVSGSYNYIRFENPLNFGIRYQLCPDNGLIYYGTFFKPVYLTDGLFDYLLAPLVPLNHVPWIAPLHQFFLPSFLHTDRIREWPVAGAFYCFPIMLIGVVSLYHLKRANIGQSNSLRLIIMMLLASTIVQILTIASFWCTCFRYEHDFLNPLSILTGIGLMAIIQRKVRFPFLLAAYSCVIGVLLGWPGAFAEF